MVDCLLGTWEAMLQWHLQSIFSKFVMSRTASLKTVSGLLHTRWLPPAQTQFPHFLGIVCRAKQSAKSRSRAQATPANINTQDPPILSRPQLHQNALYDSQFATPVSTSMEQSANLPQNVVEEGQISDHLEEKRGNEGLTPILARKGNQSQQSSELRADKADLLPDGAQKTSDIAEIPAVCDGKSSHSPKDNREQDASEEVDLRVESGIQSENLSEHAPVAVSSPAQQNSQENLVGDLKLSEEPTEVEEKVQQSILLQQPMEEGISVKNSGHEDEGRLQAQPNVKSQVPRLSEAEDVAKSNVSSGQNLVTSHRSLLPGKTQAQAPLAGRKAAEVPSKAPCSEKSRYQKRNVFFSNHRTSSLLFFVWPSCLHISPDQVRDGHIHTIVTMWPIGCTIGQTCSHLV